MMERDACRNRFDDCVRCCNRTDGFFDLSAGSVIVGQKKSAPVSWRKVGT